MTDVSSSAATRPRRVRRRGLVVLLVAVFAVVLAGAGLTYSFVADDRPGPVVARSNPLLPDLAMGPIRHISVGTTDDGKQRLRFDAMIVNVGAGPFLVRADRGLIGNNPWHVDQWIAEAGGGFSVRPTDANLIYAGDGHNHWHVAQVEVHKLDTLEGENKGTLVKQGFCFFDTDSYRPDLPGSPEKAQWGSKGCESPLGNHVRMGLSVGWGDTYPWNLLDERIDITGLPDGVYRIRQVADPNNQFEEADETNNETWVDVRLAATADGLREVTVVQEGPAP